MISTTQSTTFLAELEPKLSWYIARSSGIVSWILLTASVLWGLLLSARILNKATAPGWLLDLHRYLGALSIVLTGVHIAGLVGDNWMHIGWGDVLVPMYSKYRPGAVAWGVVGFYLLVAIEVTSLIRTRIPRKLWRSTHYLSFPLFIACTVHGLQAGKDAHTRAYEWLTVGATSIAILLLLLRIVATRGSKSRRTTQTTSTATSGSSSGAAGSPA
jgi:predicted ferric reductase